MSDPALALQKALYDALTASGATEAGDNVFDAVPASDPFPRITIGDMQTIGNRADCYDGSEVFLTIDVWSRATGYPEVKRIASEVRDVLDDNESSLSLEGHVLDLMEFGDAVFSRDPDGLTRRARMSIRALTQTEDPASP